ncbi:hypothetical protein Slala03_50970 [Streptomyces lavendulae subsp. lavendulae]|nr:hypothetical protein Slala03_50970 [Streptomyces lavendulae subsp. lavendulae]
MIYDPGTWGMKGPFIGRVAALGVEHISYAMGDKALTLDGQSWATIAATPRTPASTWTAAGARCPCRP